MAKLKKPRLRKFPKAPKASASMEVWTRYHVRVKEVKGWNDKVLAEYEKKRRAIDQKKKDKQKLIDKTKKLKAA